MPKLDYMNRMESTKKTRYVMLTLTHDCNLRCRYCYEPNKSRDHYMSIETAKQAVAEYMDADDGFEGVQFDFFGGEPMLAFDVIRELVDWFHSQPERWRKNHQFYIGTNGTTLPEEAKPWLLKYRQCVLGGVSLDGNRIAHNLNRSNSYDQVMENLPFYRELWPTQPCKMTISAETIPHVADSIIDLEEKGIPFTANLVFEDIWGAPEQKTQLLDVYAEQLDRLVDYYTARPDLFPAFMLSRKLEYVSRPTDLEAPSRDCVRFCGAGHETVMVDVDGTHYPCHRFAPWITGKPAPSGPVNRHAEWRPQQCAECDLVGLCPTCAGGNWNENGDASIRTTHHCEAFKLELLATAKLLANRLSQNQPKDVVNLPVEEASKIKRQLDTILKFASVGV